MKLIFVCFIILVFQECAHSNEEYVTILSPRTVSTDNDNTFSPLIIPSRQLNSQTKVAIQFRGKNETKQLNKNVNPKISYSLKSSINTNHVNMFMTFYRSIRGNDMCITKHYKINIDKQRFNTFIQTDKPIYKPSDRVRFRILVLKNDMTPLEINQINVTIIDPYNITMQQFDELSDNDNNYGIFEDSFEISNDPNLGDWKLRVVVDKKDDQMVSKIFSVQKYVLPLFNIYMDIQEKDIVLPSKLVISFFAQYSFGDFVRGDVKITLNDLSKNREKIRTYEYVENTKKFEILVDDLVDSSGMTILKITLEFTEEESKKKIKKIEEVNLYRSNKPILSVRHHENFIPDTTFQIDFEIICPKVFCNTKLSDKIELELTIRKGSNRKKHLPILNVKDNKAIFSDIFDSNTTQVDIVAKHMSTTYRQTIRKTTLTATYNELIVTHNPIKPEINDTINIRVSFKESMDTIIMSVNNRHGIIETKTIICNSQTCSFSIKYIEEMKPHSTVSVYYVKNSAIMFRGSTKITTEDIYKNHLKLNLSKQSVKAKENVKMTYESRDESEVFVLAFDKRLKYLREGNEIAKDDIIKSTVSYDSENIIGQIILKDWIPCTKEETIRIRNGLDNLVAQSGNSIQIARRSDSNDDEESGHSNNEKEQLYGSNGIALDSILRSNFDEVWIYKRFKIQSGGKFVDTLQVPDSMTTWQISAFSVHKTHGFALASPNELIVKNEFFMVMNLPYSIRYQEILKVDILVFNYVGEDLRVKVNLKNDKKMFEFVSFDKNECRNSYSNESKEVEINVSDKRVGKVFFFIRRKSQEDSLINSHIKLHATAIGSSSDKNYADSILKTLLVEPIGVRVFNFQTFTNNFLNYTEITEGITYDIKSSGVKLKNITIYVSGEYMSELKLSDDFKTYPKDCLQQRTSRLKGDAERYRHFMKKNKILEYHKNNLSESLQELYGSLNSRFNIQSWGYKDTSGFIAHLVDAIGTTLVSGIMKQDENTYKELKTRLDELKSRQSGGKFGEFGFNIGFNTNGTALKIVQTAYILTQFIKFQHLFVNEYDLVINDSFQYLELNKDKADYLGTAITAYCYALNNQTKKAKDELESLDSIKIDHNDVQGMMKKICYPNKNSKKTRDCNLLESVYVALAYLKLGDIENAEPIVNWLIATNRISEVSLNTIEYAFTMEPIAELANLLENPANLTIKMSNNFKSLEFNILSDSQKNFETYFPKQSKAIEYDIKGIGFWSITSVAEQLYIESLQNNIFSLNLDLKLYNNQPKNRELKVCARQKEIDEIVNVIYEIELPSGHKYVKYLETSETKKFLRSVVSEKGGEFVVLYFEDFEKNENICVSIIIEKVFDVKEFQKVGVKVYDYDSKDKATIEFYKFDEKPCQIYVPTTEKPWYYFFWG